VKAPLVYIYRISSIVLSTVTGDINSQQCDVFVKVCSVHYTNLRIISPSRLLARDESGNGIGNSYEYNTGVLIP